MGHVTLSLNGRLYRLRCGDGEEARLKELADDIGRRIDDLAIEFGQYGDERLLLMVTLMLADELMEAKAATPAPETAQDDMAPGEDNGPPPDESAHAEAADATGSSQPPRDELPPEDIAASIGEVYADGGTAAAVTDEGTRQPATEAELDLSAGAGSETPAEAEEMLGPIPTLRGLASSRSSLEARLQAARTGQTTSPTKADTEVG